MKLRPTGANAGLEAAEFPTARKMVARMLEQGHKDVLYYENMEGGTAERLTTCNAHSCRAILGLMRLKWLSSFLFRIIPVEQRPL